MTGARTRFPGPMLSLPVMCRIAPASLAFLTVLSLVACAQSVPAGPARLDASFVDRGDATPSPNPAESCVVPLATGSQGVQPLGRYCIGDGDCTSGTCVGNQCIQNCATRADCPVPANWTCLSGDGGGVCACTSIATPEVCNGLDDDCDGLVDELVECPVGSQCVAGACDCGPESRCAGNCVDLQNDPGNCGACGHACALTELCSDGVCAPLRLAELTIEYEHACALLVDGTVRCWGINDAGSLGEGSVDAWAESLNSHPPTYVRPRPVLGLEGAVGLAAGKGTCAVVRDGEVKCWGNWRGHGLRDGDFGERGEHGFRFYPCSTHPSTLCEISSVRQLVSGSRHTCALLDDGSVGCWGSNPLRQLGDGTTVDSMVAVRVHGASRVVQLAAGESHTCALRVDGTVLCWGSNDAGQLGDGSPLDSSDHPPAREPADVSGLSDVVQLTAGQGFTCALRAGGTVMCWGWAQYGEIGDGNAVGSRSTPVEVVGLAGVLEIAAGDIHACARSSDGTVRCWGSIPLDGMGGTSFTRPVRVPGISDAARVWSGRNATCVLRADDGLWCWGGGSPAQYADGPSAFFGTPARVQW